MADDVGQPGGMSRDASARDTLAQDWATLWQSELAAIAADPETTLGLEALFSAWLQAARAFDPAAWERPAWPDAPAWSTPAGAAAGARDATIEAVAKPGRRAGTPAGRA